MRRAPDILHLPLDARALPRGHDAAASAAVLTRIRSRGELRLGFRRTLTETIIADSYQAGCLKLRVPRHPPGCPPEAVLINTSGGLCAGDRLAQHIHWGGGD